MACADKIASTPRHTWAKMMSNPPAKASVDAASQRAERSSVLSGGLTSSAPGGTPTSHPNQQHPANDEDHSDDDERGDRESGKSECSCAGGGACYSGACVHGALPSRIVSGRESAGGDDGRRAHPLPQQKPPP